MNKIIYSTLISATIFLSIVVLNQANGQESKVQSFQIGEDQLTVCDFHNLCIVVNADDLLNQKQVQKLDKLFDNMPNFEVMELID